MNAPFRRSGTSIAIINRFRGDAPLIVVAIVFREIIRRRIEQFAPLPSRSTVTARMTGDVR